MIEKKSSLTVVGTGIKFLSQLTIEAKAHIEKADKVLYLVNHPIAENWFNELNKNSESLNTIYFGSTSRNISYQAITDYIIENLSQYNHVCVALYGHPTVFAKPALDAAVIAKHLGHETKILPGISALDCLFADLLIDPGTCGCHSFEATDFLLYKRKFDVNSHLILWQVGAIAAQGHDFSNNQVGVQVLQEYLQLFYPENHTLTKYEAAQYPGMKAEITVFSLSQFAEMKMSDITTLYIPPLGISNLDKLYAMRLGLL